VTMNAFNLVAVAPRRRHGRRVPLLARMTPTHPPLEARIDALHELERAQHLRRA
jgi:hypothetical protein